MVCSVARKGICTRLHTQSVGVGIDIDEIVSRRGAKEDGLGIARRLEGLADSSPIYCKPGAVQEGLASSKAKVAVFLSR